MSEALSIPRRKLLIGGGFIIAGVLAGCGDVSGQPGTGNSLGSSTPAPEGPNGHPGNPDDWGKQVDLVWSARTDLVPAEFSRHGASVDEGDKVNDDMRQVVCSVTRNVLEDYKLHGCAIYDGKGPVQLGAPPELTPFTFEAHPHDPNKYAFRIFVGAGTLQILGVGLAPNPQSADPSPIPYSFATKIEDTTSVTDPAWRNVALLRRPM